MDVVIASENRSRAHSGVYAWGTWQQDANRTSAENNSRRSLLKPLLVGIVFVVIAVVTVLGNALVCVTVVRIRKLRTTTNYFIVSLAVCDLLLGCLVLPLSAINTLLSDWPLGPVFCNLYISTDVTLCTVSILTLFGISLDRYVAVTSPLRYSQIVTSRRVTYAITAVWMSSVLLAFAPIHLGWNTNSGVVQNYADRNSCVFEANAVYALVVAGGTYFAPLVVMCAVYVRVLKAARNHVKSINELARLTRHITTATATIASPAGSGLVSDTKATITLASVIVAFTLCWVPYFVLFTVRPFLAQDFPQMVSETALWLGYANSMLNPFLYAFHSHDFRHAFLHILCRPLAERYAKKHPPQCFV